MSPDLPPLPLDTLLENVEGMRRLAQRLVRDPALAEDVAQDAVLVALSKGPRNRRNVRGWLNGIVRNVARESRRSAQRRTRYEGAAPAPSETPDPLSRTVQIAEQRRLLDAVESLPEPYRETVWQRYFEDRKPRAIARDAGIPVETVRTRLKRAKAMLRTRLDAAHDGDRRAWALALAPLGLSGTSWVLPSLIGVALMTTKTKVGALVVLVLLAAGSAWWIAASERVPEEADTSALPPDATVQPALEAEAAKLKGRGRSQDEVLVEPDAGDWRIAGRTLDPAEDPLAGVEVRAAPPDVQDIGAMPVVARSRTDGLFSFVAPRDAEELRVVASVRGRLDAVARMRRADPTPLVLNLPAVPTYVFRFLDGQTDEPLPDVTCTVRRKAGALLWERVFRADETGVVTLPSPTADALDDKLAVMVQHPGYRTLMELPRPRSSSPARPRDVYLFSAPRLVLEAQDPEGRPVAGIRIRAWAGSPSLSTEAPEWRMDTLRHWADGTGTGFDLGDARTNDAGRVVFDLGPSRLTWFAHAMADGLAGMAHGSSSRKNEDAHVVIELATTVRVVGRVTDAAGAPVARARVGYRPWYLVERMRGGGRISVPPDECARHWRTMTNAAGEYELDDLPLPAAPAEVHLQAHRGDLGTAFVQMGGPAEANETRRIDLVLTSEYEAGSIRVVDEAGRPIEGALVTFGNMLPGMLTDAEGHARLLVYPGTEGPFRAYKQGYRVGSAQPSEEGTATITVGRAHVLRGRVFDRNGTPRGAYVDVYDPKLAALPEDERNQIFTDLWFGRAHADIGGHFRVDDLPPGPYFVRCWYSTQRGGKHKTVVCEEHVMGDAPVELRLPEAEPPAEPTGVLAGTVVGADGQPLTEYWLTLEKPRGSAGPDLKGRRFRFETVVPGTWKLTAGTGGGEQRTETSVVVRAGEQTDVRVVLAPSLAIQGRLVDEAGMGIPGTYVQLVRGEALNAAGLQRTDEEGRFAMKNLLPGRYRARVRLVKGETPYVTSNEVFVLRAGHAEEVVLEAQPAATLVLDLDDERFLVHDDKWFDERFTERGQRSLLSRVTVTTPAGEKLVEVGLFHGRRTFHYPLTPGNYDLLVKTHKEGSFRTSFSVEDAEQTVVRIVLEK